jgi:geranylgeranyl diphosphate synthase, type I
MGTATPTVQRRVESRLADFVLGKVSATAAGSEGRSLVGPVAELILAPAKRLRAVMCYWGWRAAGGTDCAEIIAAGAALELLHGMALVHDDVIDRSPLRRGRATVHHRFAADHRTSRWQGSSMAFGVAAAMLAGDLCGIWADTLLRESGLPLVARARAAAVYDNMREQAVHGQYLELIEQARGGTDLRSAWAICAAKTAATTTTGPLVFGATLAGGNEGIVRACHRYAEPLGVAFQLRDDLLGAFGDPAETGKPSGDDLRDGKPTALLAIARERGGAAVGARIDELTARSGHAALEQLRTVVRATNAHKVVADLVADLGRQARAALAGAPFDAAVRSELAELATALTGPH